MENSGKIVIGGSDVPEWHVAKGERILGPMTAEEVFEKVNSGEISWVHFAFKQGESNWRRLCDIEEFQAGVPTKPRVEAPEIRKVEKRRGPPPAPVEDEDKRIWFLYYNKSQFGPFSQEEIDRFLRIGKIHGRVHAWKDGMENWMRIEDLGIFDESVKEAFEARKLKSGQAASGSSMSGPAGPKSSAQGSQGSRGAAPQEKENLQPKPIRLRNDGTGLVEHRETPRRPLVARLLMTDDQEVITGMCRDVSIGGMQVLTDQIPGEAGAVIKLNVSPSGKSQDGSFQPFVAEGEIVRILEDGRGFSFRFRNLTEGARQIIEQYIATES